MRVAYRVKVPLIGGIPPPQVNLKRSYENYNRATRHMALVKPGRRLGGAWIDEFVSARRAVSLCMDCRRKYGDDWFVRAGYERREQAELTDCDGCGTELSFCLGFYARITSNKESP